MLHERLTGYLNYFERLATQPPNRWEGFYISSRDEQNFGLRFQLAFACYALAALCLHPDADADEQDRCRTAMASLIERMLQRRVWAYWASRTEAQGIAPDPIIEANGQYSGLLAMMIGAFEAVGGDQRYDEPFTLLWTSDARFNYTHTSLVELLWRQMRAGSHGGVEAEPGRVSAHTMTHLLWANLLHDRVHGSEYAAANARWLEFMQAQLVLHGPRLPGRGALSMVYLTRYRMAAPISTNLTDAWTLALLAGLEPELAGTLMSRFRPRIRRTTTVQPDAEGATVGQAFVPSAGRWRNDERADNTLASGFSYLLAVELGDTALADELLAYADLQLQPALANGERCYGGGLAAPYTTALFAMGEAGGLRALCDVAALRVQRVAASVDGLDLTEIPTLPDNVDHS